MSELEPGAEMVEIRKKVGRPPHCPTDKTKHMVEEAVGMGLEQVKIAQLLDIAPKTLRRCYRHELDVGVIKANLSVAKALHKRAVSGNDTIAKIFWLKARAGWVDTKTPDANLPSQIQVTFALPDPKDAVGQQTAMVDVTPKETEETRETEEEPEPS